MAEVYVVNVDELKVDEYPMGDICDLDGFNREMDETFGAGEWTLNDEEARYNLFVIAMNWNGALPDKVSKQVDEVSQYWDIDTEMAMDMIFNPACGEKVSNLNKKD